MEVVMLISPPFESLSEHLTTHLTRTPPYARFMFAVAWARLSGINQIDQELAQFPGEKIGIVGLEFARTSYEALAVLRQVLDELWILHTASHQTFHPKGYVFLPHPDHTQQHAVRIIGSSNLTFGGLDYNYELSAYQTFDPTTEEGQHEIAHTVAYFDRLRATPSSERIVSLEQLEELLLDRYLCSERTTPSRPTRSATPPSILAAQDRLLHPIQPQRQRRSSTMPLPDLPDLPPEPVAAEHEDDEAVFDLAADDAVGFDPVADDIVAEEADMRSEQAAVYLSLRLGWEISPAMVLNWASRGYFPNSYKLRDTRPSPRFFPRADLDAFIPPVFSHWGPGKPKYQTAEEREAADRESRRRHSERTRKRPPEGYIEVAEALAMLGTSRQRLHQLVARGEIRTDPSYEDRVAAGHRHQRVWYHQQDIQRFIAQRTRGTDHDCS
jgi:HKD family nuclease